MKAIKLITRTFRGVLDSYFISDMDVMSEEAKKIFSNEDDRKKYIEAVEKLKNKESGEEVITLSTKEQITLVS